MMSKVIFGIYSWSNSYRKNTSPLKRQRRFEDNSNENQGLNFAQAAYSATSMPPGICPCCKQTLPPNLRNVNLNWDKNFQVVPAGQRPGMLSPTAVKFQENAETPSPNAAPKITVKPLEEEKGKDKDKDKKSKRKRKNKSQIKKLEEEFSKNAHWTNEDVDRISRDLKLDKSQVYKWNWDQKKKYKILPSKVYVVQIPEESGEGAIKGEGKEIYVKSFQDALKLKQLAKTNTQEGDDKKPK